MRATVIIPVYNAEDFIHLCLDALMVQTYSDFEIIVVDNGSQDRTCEIIEAYPNVKLYFQNDVKSSYAARNVGIKHTIGELFAFTDADCIPDPDWLEKGLFYLQSSEKIGLVGGNIQLFYKKGNHLSFAEIYEKHTAFQQQRYIEQYNFAATANMFTRRSVLNDIGFFNEELKSNGDKEWGQRVHNTNYQLVYAKDVVVKHPARYTLKELYSKRIRVIGGAEALRNKTGILSIIDYDLLDGIIPPIKDVKSILTSNIKTTEKLIALIIVVSMNILSTFTRLKLRLGGTASR